MSGCNQRKESTMKIVIAIDSFKGSLTSLEAGKAARKGILRVCPDARISVRPLADGGEGTVAALTLGMGGHTEKVTVTGPLGRPVECAYGILGDGQTAVMEMSAAAGITLVPADERNPMATTTYGVGEVIRDAIAKGCRRFIVGIGGSATNDGGIGMLQALGYGMLNANGEQVSFGAKGLGELQTITDDSVIPELCECSFRIACDVTNPLCGKNGASAVYGPQKGSSPSMVLQMDQWLNAYADLIASLTSNPNADTKQTDSQRLPQPLSFNNAEPARIFATSKKYPRADKNQAGTGAAGGLGFAFLAFTNAVLESGVRIVLEETHIEDYIKDADLIVTGEGRLDAQTVMGKAPAGVAQIAKKYGKPVIAFSGSATSDAGACNDAGIDAFFPILQSVITLEEAMDRENAARNLADTAEQVFRLVKLLGARQAAAENLL